VRDRNEALELVDWEICVPESQLPALPEGEYYWHQLEGLQVVTLDWQLLGRVDHLLEAGSTDVLGVKPRAGRTEQRKRLLSYRPDLYVMQIGLADSVTQVDWDPEF